MLKWEEDFVNFCSSCGTRLCMPVMSQVWFLTCLLIARVSTENNSTNGTFTPPPAQSMSRLLPSPGTTVVNKTMVNETKNPDDSAAASSVEIVTTPDPQQQQHSLGLSAYSKFNEDAHNFQPSPFLGVISEQAHVNSYPNGVVVGEVFPDTVDKPNPHLGAHKYLYSIEGQRNLHTGHAYHDQVTIQRPSPAVTASYLVNRPSPTPGQSHSLYDKKESTKSFEISGSTFRPAHLVPEYPFEIPGKPLLRDVDNFQHVDNSIAEYKPFVPFNDHKPIHEDVIEEKPFRHDLRPPPILNFPGDAGMIHSPKPHHFSHPKPIQIHPKQDNKWRDALKFFGSLIPIGLLLAAFTPSLIVVNATEAPTDTSPVKRTAVQSGRALEELPTSLSLNTLRLTSCQRRKMCDSLTVLKDSKMRTTVYELMQRSGESYEELLELSGKKQCSTIACPST